MISRSLIFAKRIIFKNKVSTVVFCLAIILIFFVFESFLTPGTNDEALSKCESTVQKSAKSLSDVGSVNDYNHIYKTLKTQDSSCASHKKLLVINKDSAAYKLKQIQFYHDRATTGYMLGHIKEAKEDAKRGLSIDKQLGNSDKKLKNYAHLISDMKYVEAGTF